MKANTKKLLFHVGFIIGLITVVFNVVMSSAPKHSDITMIEHRFQANQNTTDAFNQVEADTCVDERHIFPKTIASVPNTDIAKKLFCSNNKHKLNVTQGTAYIVLECICLQKEKEVL